MPLARVKDYVDGETLEADELDASFDNIVDYINALEDINTGHDHDGSDSKKVSYLNLTNKPSDKNAFLFPVTGSLSTGTDVAPLHHETWEAAELVEVRAVLKTPASGADVIIDITADNNSIWNNGANRLTIPAGQKKASTTTIDVTSVAKGQTLKLDIDQVGSSVAGADLTVYLIYKITL